MDSKTSQYWEYNIETLSEQLESLQIIEEVSEKTTEYIDEILTVPVPVNQNNEQAELPKNMVSDSERFDGNKINFEDW